MQKWNCLLQFSERFMLQGPVRVEYVQALGLLGFLGFCPCTPLLFDRRWSKPWVVASTSSEALYNFQQLRKSPGQADAWIAELLEDMVKGWFKHQMLTWKVNSIPAKTQGSHEFQHCHQRLWEEGNSECNSMYKSISIINIFIFYNVYIMMYIIIYVYSMW